MKKFMVWLSILIVAFAMNAVPVLASVDVPVNISSASDQTEISPRAEETVWVVRKLDGKRQRRLWSLTYERWLTDWLDWPED